MGKGLPRSMARASGAIAPIQKQTIVLDALAIAVANGSGAPGFGTTVIGDFPEGNILFLGIVSNVQFSSADAEILATFDGDYSIGTTPASDGTLTDGDVDLIPSTPLGAATDGVSPALRTAHAVAVTGTVYDNTDGSLELNLNLLIDDASQTAAVDVTATGTVVLAYIVLGDD
jgi:hypothetical protein